MNDSTRLYTPSFFLLFAVVFCFICGFSLQFHFGQYVAFLGGNESQLGWVLGLGVIGSLCTRPIVGVLIDRFGPKPGLLVGALLGMGAAVSYPWTRHLTVICLLRVLSMMALALFTTAGAVLAARIAPPRRRAESLGTIGIGGFLGMIVGPTLGDVIFSRGTADPAIYHVFFGVSGGAFLAVALLASMLRVSGAEERRAASPALLLRVVVGHWPGMILLIGMVFTLSQTFHFAFLERMAEKRGFENIKVFFLAYCPTAIVLRFVFRRLPETFGRRRTCIMGMLLYGAGIAALATAYSQRGLILPAMIMGAGHCFIFPSMVDIAAEKLPREYRGLGTSLIFGAGDVGLLVGNIVWGQLIAARGYNTALVFVAGVGVAAAIIYAWSQRTIVFRRRR